MMSILNIVSPIKKMTVIELRNFKSENYNKKLDLLRKEGIIQ